MPNQDDKFARLSRRSAEGQTIQAAADVVIRPDQQGSQSAAAILESAQNGQVIRISAGTYRFDRPVKILRSVTIVGDGKAATRLISAAPGDCFLITGAIDCSLTGISFEHEGDTVGNVVKVDAHKIELKSCRFSGARELSAESKDQGVGLVVLGRTDIICDECESNNNHDAGLAFMGDSTATVTSCTVTANAVGIAAGSRSRVVLCNNGAIRNKVGILMLGSSTGEVSGNDCSDNELTGIDMAENASPSLSGNSARRNSAGIIFGQQSSGRALKNTCSDNSLSGIDLRDEAHPILDGNRCDNNGNRGIAAGDNTYGSIRSNTCNNNVVFGIVVLDEAHPIVDGNTCMNNGEIGIGYKGRATGICRNNKCEGHLANVHVVENANPQLEDEGGSPVSASTASGNANSQSGDCFVVTATFGTPFAPEVQRFRQYRDSVLLQNVTGRLFIRIYYVIGPKLAGIIRRVPILRRASAKMLGRLAEYLPD